MEIFKRVHGIFWHEAFWLPHSVTWTDLENHDGGIYHPQAVHLNAAFLMGVVLFVFRFLFQRIVARPIGLLFAADTPRAKAPKNKILEAVYRKHKKPSYGIIQGLAKQTDLSQRQIERWLRVRRNQDKINTLDKFTEGCGRFAVHTLLLVSGVVVLWDAPWIWESDEFWRNYPHQHVSNSLYWYYITELGHFISSLASHCLYRRKKDFWPMLIHHIVAIMLMTLSWCVNFVRLGTTVLLIHDWADPLLEATKLCSYAEQYKLFGVFLSLMTVTWVVTRLFVFPYKCIWGMWITPLVNPVVWTFYFALFICLFILHCIWTIFLVKFIMRVFTTKVWRDTRSSEEEEVSDECQQQRNHHVNNKC